MPKRLLIVLFLTLSISSFAQPDKLQNDSLKRAQDSIKKTEFFRTIGNGYFPFNYFNIDLRYLIKFNQYEGFRTGLGGITNDRFSERYRINSYLVYGFKDKRYKYSIGGGFRINETSNTWINLSYTDDLQETGSSNFLTDKRFFTFFEPRLLNIDLFHRHITKAIAIEHKITNHLLSETQFATSKINPTYNYTFIFDDQSYNNFDLSFARISLQWNPFSSYKLVNERIRETKNGFPKFTFQFTQSFKSVLGSDFNFSKLDFRTIHEFVHKNESVTRLTISCWHCGWCNTSHPSLPCIS